jgi:hypothetical protein
MSARQETVALALEHRDQHTQGLFRVADQVGIHRVPDADHAAVDVDLHPSGLALRRSHSA